MRAGWARPGKQPGQDVCVCHPCQGLRLRIEGDLLIRANQAHKALCHPSRVQVRQECIKDVLIGLQGSATSQTIREAPIVRSVEMQLLCLNHLLSLLLHEGTPGALRIRISVGFVGWGQRGRELAFRKPRTWSALLLSKMPSRREKYPARAQSSAMPVSATCISDSSIKLKMTLLMLCSNGGRHQGSNDRQ